MVTLRARGIDSRTPRQKKGPRKGPTIFLAGGEGFEPPLTESESVVLPLDDPPSSSDRFPDA